MQLSVTGVTIISWCKLLKAPGELQLKIMEAEENDRKAANTRIEQELIFILEAIGKEA